MIWMRTSSSMSQFETSIPMALRFISMYSSDFLDPLSIFRVRSISLELFSTFFTSPFSPRILNPNLQPILSHPFSCLKQRQYAFQSSPSFSHLKGPSSTTILSPDLRVFALIDSFESQSTISKSQGKSFPVLEIENLQVNSLPISMRSIFSISLMLRWSILFIFRKVFSKEGFLGYSISIFYFWRWLNRICILLTYLCSLVNSPLPSQTSQSWLEDPSSYTPTPLQLQQTQNSLGMEYSILGSSIGFSMGLRGSRKDFTSLEAIEMIEAF